MRYVASIREERRKNSNIESIRKDIYSFLESNMGLEELVTKLSKNDYIKYKTTPEYIRTSLEDLQRKQIERDKYGHGSVGMKMKVSAYIYTFCNSVEFPVVYKEPRTYTEIISVGQDIIEKNKEVNGSNIIDVYLTEELAELTQELMKKARNKSHPANLLGEIADVYYTLSMFIQDNNISIGDINEKINFKQDRARKILNNN